jgi:hypothetical protein
MSARRLRCFGSDRVKTRPVLQNRSYARRVDKTVGPPILPMVPIHPIRTGGASVVSHTIRYNRLTENTR